MSNKPTPQKIEEIVKSFINEGKLMQVITCQNNQPWVANVWYSFDENLNFYFISRNSRRHSQELRKQSKVAGNIALPPFEGLGQKARAVAFEGIAEEVGMMASKEAFNIYRKRWPQAIHHITDKDILKNLTKVRFYKITPTLFVLFDEVSFPDDARQELSWGNKDKK